MTREEAALILAPETSRDALWKYESPEERLEACNEACQLGASALREQEERRWIQVSDPPKEKGCYFVTVKHWLDGKPVAREAYWNGVDWLSCERRQEITPRVTHWMPLPEPPKEDA